MLLHIGYHKTGTTFIQTHVFTRENGFLVPWTVFTGEPIEHFVLTHPLRFDAKAVRRAFDRAIETAGDHALIPAISHEDLSGHPLWSRYYGFDVAERLHATFPEAKVLIAVREQKSMLRSLFGQYIVQDGLSPLSEFIGTGNELPGFRPICRLDHLEYDMLVGRYRELFGDEQVLVLPFELLRKDAIAFEQSIYDFAGSPMRARGSHPPENVGLGAMTLAVNQWLNQFARKPKLPGPDYWSWPWSYRTKLRVCRVLQKVIPARWHHARDQAIRRYIADRVGDYFKDSNHRLAAMTGLDLRSLGYDVAEDHGTDRQANSGPASRVHEDARATATVQ